MAEETLTRTETSPSTSVQCNLGGPDASVAVGVCSSVSVEPELKHEMGTAIAIGLGSRAHTAAAGEAVAVGMAVLAEVSKGGYFACAVGHYPKAVAHSETGGAIAIGFGPEAHALGKEGVAIAIYDGDDSAVVSAGPGGRLVIVRLSKCDNSRVFEQEIDGRTFRAGRRYTVGCDGEWSEIVDGDEPIYEMAELRHAASQVGTAA